MVSSLDGQQRIPFHAVDEGEQPQSVSGRIDVDAASRPQEYHQVYATDVSQGTRRSVLMAKNSFQELTYDDLQPRPSTSSCGSAQTVVTTPSFEENETQFEMPSNFQPSHGDSSDVHMSEGSSAKEVSGEKSLATTVHVVPVSGIEIERPPHHHDRHLQDLTVVSILHYEFKDRLGQPFKCNTLNLWVDGFCGSGDPTRFSLGSLGNSSRQAGVIPVRGQIGKGMQMQYDDGRTKITCLSESPLFVQAPLHAKSVNDDMATVYRLSGVAEGDSVENRTVDVFDEVLFEKLLEEARQQGYQHVYALQSLCICRVSFVKGFGKSYRRMTILDTPCWIEIHFINYLQKLDKVLSSLPSPTGDALSIS